jgi:hypothetical protein
MYVPYALQLYFQQLRPLISCAAEDGPVVAHLLLNHVEENLRSHELSHRIRTFCSTIAMLRNCGFVHFSAMLGAMVSFNIRTAALNHMVIATDPALVTEEQATAIGCELMCIVLERSGSALALDNFVQVYAALRTMSRKYPWFVPLLKTVLMRRAAASSKTGAVQRVQKRLSRPGADNSDLPQQILCPQSFDAVVRTLVIWSQPASAKLGIARSCLKPSCSDSLTFAL